MTGDLNNEIKELRKEVSDLKISLQFTQAKDDEMAKRLTSSRRKPVPMNSLLTSHLITLKQWKTM